MKRFHPSVPLPSKPRAWLVAKALGCAEGYRYLKTTKQDQIPYRGVWNSGFQR